MKPSIPAAALDKHIAVLGMTGAGKTSLIKSAIVEPDLEADRRVIIITPKDDWWGLRLSKSGKGKGYDIPIFGGHHEDYPLRVADAALLAETYATMKGSAIFCTAKMSAQDRARWFSVFAETLLMKNKGAVRVVIDEAHVWMPQQGGKGGGAIPAALHAGNELVSQGRSQGLRVVLASQRSAKLHNDSLTQCPCLIAMMLMAPHDRDAVKRWIEDQADPQVGKQIISSLAVLKPGEAWVWAPSGNMLERMQFARPTTYDSSAAPSDDAADAPTLAPINLDALQGKLAKIEAEKKATDPKALQAEVARLQRELTSKSTAAAAAPEALKAEYDAGYSKGYVKGKIDGYGEALQGVKAEATAAGSALANLDLGLKGMRSALAQIDEWAKRPQPTPQPPAAVPRPAPTVAPQTPSRAVPATPSGDTGVTKSRQRVLDAIAWWRSIGFEPVERRRACLVAGLSPTASTFGVYVGELIRRGLIETSDDGLSLTREGLAQANQPAETPSADALRAMVREQLPDSAARVFDVIYNAYPNAIPRDLVADEVGLSRTASTLGVYIGKASSIGLVENAGPGQVKVSDWLFEPRRAAE